MTTETSAPIASPIADTWGKDSRPKRVLRVTPDDLALMREVIEAAGLDKANLHRMYEIERMGDEGYRLLRLAALIRRLDQEFDSVEVYRSGTYICA